MPLFWNAPDIRSGGIARSRAAPNEIDAALKAADVVVVLWSRLSVESAWVRDEAAAGRDRGCLVPVKLDAAEPPLGFTQYQTVDLSRWKGRGDSRQLDELIAAVSAPTEAYSSPGIAPARRTPPIPPMPVRVWFGLVAVLFIAVAGGAWWYSSRAQAHTPVLAIETAGDSTESREVARQLAVRLGELQSAQGNAFQLITGPARADLMLQVDASDSPTILHRDVSVLSGADRAILWSASLQQPADKGDALSQQLTLTAERVLSCGLEALSDRKDRIDGSTLTFYLSACSRLADVYGNDQYHPELEHLFEQVVDKARHFAGAWARLLEGEA